MISSDFFSIGLRRRRRPRWMLVLLIAVCSKRQDRKKKKLKFCPHLTFGHQILFFTVFTSTSAETTEVALGET